MRTKGGRMDRQGLTELLNGYGYTEKQVAECVEGAVGFEQFLDSSAGNRTVESATPEDVHAFAAQLVEAGDTNRNHLVGVYFFANYINNHAMTIGILDLLDGFEIWENFHRAIGDVLGEEIQAEIFEGLELPRLGTTPLDWTRLNAIVMPRLEAVADRETVEQILGSGLRNLPDERYQQAKERYEELGNLEAFLEARGKQHFETLQKHHNEDTLYFNQRITPEVLEFVKKTPEIGRGVRDGNRIIEIKIPHMSPEYLATDDLKLKQYYVCHCPLVKESIRSDELEISPTFCAFCPSFNAKPWEVIFGRRLKTEVLESALRGGKWCKFAIYLPEEKL